MYTKIHYHQKTKQKEKRANTISKFHDFVTFKLCYSGYFRQLFYVKKLDKTSLRILGDKITIDKKKIFIQLIGETILPPSFFFLFSTPSLFSPYLLTFVLVRFASVIVQFVQCEKKVTGTSALRYEVFFLFDLLVNSKDFQKHQKGISVSFFFFF